MGFQETVNGWAFALSETFQAYLRAGSATAIVVAFGGGLLATLTPCVYPMIPVTVSFIGGAAGGNRRRSVILSSAYVGGLAVTYALLGVIAASVGWTFGDLGRKWWIYAGVSALMIVFALAMIDVITIPMLMGSLQGAGARRGGFAGATLMGVAFAFIAAPCVGPILGGLLLYVSQTRDVVWGGTLMLSFALGLGLPFIVLGAFTGLLVGIPKPGGWMMWIKRGFAALLLLIAAYYMWAAYDMFAHRGGRA